MGNGDGCASVCVSVCVKGECNQYAASLQSVCRRGERVLWEWPDVTVRDTWRPPPSPDIFQSALMTFKGPMSVLSDECLRMDHPRCIHLYGHEGFLKYCNTENPGSSAVKTDWSSMT